MADKKISLKAIKLGLLGDSQVDKTAVSHSFLNYELEIWNKIYTKRWKYN